MRAHFLGRLSGAIAVISGSRAQPPIKNRSALAKSSLLGVSLSPEVIVDFNYICV